MGEGQNEMAQNRSMLRDFMGSLATMGGGDLSNITAPPFVLDNKSTVELPAFWAENPSIFCAPALSDDPAHRALLVLKWFLSSLRNQNYMGHSEDHGVKKPLNAFLGEIFLGKWEDNMGTTRLVSEQVSHHPPITACHVWNSQHGVSASGYTRQSVTFNGTVSIKQTGHALFTLSKHDNESYLIPLPELKVKGIFSGCPYPELNGKYYIPSTNGYMSVINFSGKSWFGGGNKHAFEAKLFSEDEGEEQPIYTLKGTWNGGFTIRQVDTDTKIETFDIATQSQKTTKLSVDPVDEQDPWETRRAWAGVIDALNKGDMQGVVDAKSKLEKGQRQLRKEEPLNEQNWEQLFFTSNTEDDVADKLMQKIPGANRNLEKERQDTKGVWLFDESKWERSHRPFRGELIPDNSYVEEQLPTTSRTSIDSGRNSIASSAGGWRWSFGSRSSISSQSSRAVSVSSSPKQSIDMDRKPSEEVPRLSSSSLRISQSPHDSAISLSSGPRTPESKMDGTKPLRVETEASNLAASIPQKIPEPQVEQVLQSEEAKIGSGIEGMSISEKVKVEDYLRSVYSTAK